MKLFKNVFKNIKVKIATVSVLCIGSLIGIAEYHSYQINHKHNSHQEAIQHTKHTAKKQLLAKKVKTNKQTKKPAKTNNSNKKSNSKTAATNKTATAKTTATTKKTTTTKPVVANNNVKTNTTTANTTKKTSPTTTTKSTSSPKTTTAKTNTTSTTNNTQTTTTKYLYEDGKQVAEGDNITLTKSPFHIVVSKSGKQVNGFQGAYFETKTFTIRDSSGNIVSTLSQPSDYGTIKTLTFTPTVSGSGTINQSGSLTYKALVLNDGSGSIIINTTNKVTFTAVPSTGYKFDHWTIPGYTVHSAKLTYGFSATQKLTSGAKIEAVFVKSN